ncbi:peptidyl-tRNA hydrolase 2, mitochondrial-like [Halyomorpha halys]|uniref:peptidyl-tRNA hydrolase 2, mitochondrial-like n=1 Tax=Halyomorpha halys TaxID=286706 RepID=UPI0006D5173C|nr:peptidyl-tRNA hydrolase 2, mitochondrial-like isoform X2 [Halyomorpha halys]
MVVRSDVLKNKNQIAEHCSRAALECFKKAKLKSLEAVNLWERNGQPKIALKIDKNNNEEMLCLHRKAENLGLVSVPVMEESSCMKNITVLGIGPGSEELVNEVTGHLKLL